jgi:uncharacterized protein HemY
MDMWLVVLAMAAALSTAVWYSKAENDVYMLKLLSLMEGGEFLEMSVEATVLGFVLLVSALVFWEIVLLIKDPKRVLHKSKT